MTPRRYHSVSSIRIRDSENATSTRWPPLERGEEALAQVEDLYSKARTSPELICPLKNIEPEFTLRIQVSTDEASIIVCFAPIPDQHRLLALKEPCEFSLCKQEIDIAMVGDLWKDFRQIPRILFPVPPKKTKQQEKRETVYRRTAAK